MRLRTIAAASMVLFSIAADASSKLDDSPLLRPKKADAGAGVVLTEFDGKTWALVADEDDSAIKVFETKPPREAATIKLSGTPSQLAVTKAGKVLVALKDKGSVAILEAKGGDPRTLAQRGSIDTGGEPVALALTGDEATLLVASAWTHEMSAYAMADRSLKWKRNVSREPRAIAVLPDGSKAWINHGIGGVLTMIDVADGTQMGQHVTVKGSSGTPTRVATQGFALAMNDGKVFAPSALANPEAPEAYYGAGMETFGVTVVDALSGAAKDESKTFALATFAGGPLRLERCILPRAAAVSADGKKLVVGCAGDNEVVIMDATTPSPQATLRRRDVDDSPSAIAIDDATDSVVSWSQMGRILSISSIGEKATPLVKVTATGGSLSAAAGRGRRLFHAVDGKTANDGRACASCHTEGRDDGLVWHTPEGKRQTPMLAGRIADTAPFGWTRDAKTFHEYVTGTVSRLRGKGFTKDELDDLQAYVTSIKPPPRAAGDDAVVKHGGEVFANAGCASCHTGTKTTDGTKHKVEALGAAFPGGNFATPSLRFVGQTGPYFHDGRYGTLRALLTSDDSAMGKAKDLPTAEIDALEAYLKTL
jgi:DNA-binding beta-propeller fold protein YncE